VQLSNVRIFRTTACRFAEYCGREQDRDHSGRRRLRRPGDLLVRRTSSFAGDVARRYYGLRRGGSFPTAIDLAHSNWSSSLVGSLNCDKGLCYYWCLLFLVNDFTQFVMEISGEEKS
jgi:hypothetical protein